MAILGQAPAASTGTRPGGGIQRATPYRTTPLTPRPTTPTNRGMNRVPAGQNASMGMVRSDRARTAMPGGTRQVQPGGFMGGRIPASRTRSLRPLAMDRLPAGSMPGGDRRATGSVGQRLMPRTNSAYSPSQPQPRGPYSPTPGTAGPGYANNAQWQYAAQNRAPWEYAAQNLSMPNQPIPRNPNIGSGPITRPGWPGQPGGMIPPPMTKPRLPSPPIYGGGSGPIYGGGAGGGYDGGGINPGGMYNQPTRGLPQLPVNGGPTMGVGNGQNGQYW